LGLKKVEALFISDVHLGSKGSNAVELLEVLKKYQPKKLFIVGDFIDGWLLQKRIFWTQQYVNVIRKILSYSKKDTEVIYITGNHDEFLREYTPSQFGNIYIVDEFTWNDYLIVHGDKWDGVVQLKWLGKLGSLGYETAIFIDRTMKRFGYKKSLSKMIKNRVKEAVKFISRFEKELVNETKRRNLKGVICGHIHNPMDKYIDNIHYLNCGDWIENNSYIIYDNGNFKIHREL
jgi:UDP-2,3-diacylglucosamine pyrophosphatase LpxH